MVPNLLAIRFRFTDIPGNRKIDRLIIELFLPSELALESRSRYATIVRFGI